ncbi:MULTISPECIES: IS110 family transposase [unclassified Paenibacillus]|uniref:IS110 family transposase n=1 Tax=Paenibacillus sp. cl123 TaxID=1761875 RepID=UPI00210BC3EF|nr:MULTISPECIES: IS110 family transposase [unclassified Paenibacillus]
MPGQNESAGKRKTAKTRKGNKYLRPAFIEVAPPYADIRQLPESSVSTYRRPKGPTPSRRCFRSLHHGHWS